MNVFVIPSWYPSDDHPVNGIMIREQYEAICRINRSINVGISLWGQNEEKYLLWAKDHLKNISKIISFPENSSIKELLPNLKEYKKSAFTWSPKIARGNFRNIVKTNIHNLKAFEADFGPVQLIHVHAAQPAGLIAMEVSKHTGIPYCITERMGPFPSTFATEKDGQLTAAYKSVYTNAVANVAVSPAHANDMLRYGIKNLKVIPDFTDEKFFKPGMPKSSDNTFIFFFLGRIEQLKGIQELLEAMHIVSGKDTDISLRIAGEGVQTKLYQDLARSMQLDNAVEWLGYLTREEIVYEYQQCHAFILPSHYEAFGISYIEALACGKPVIATKCGGPESIVNASNGLLVEKENSDALAEAMLAMKDNYKTYDENRIRKNFLEKFSSAAVVPQLTNFYKSIIYGN